MFSKAGSEVDSTVKAKAAELVERIGSLGSSSSSSGSLERRRFGRSPGDRLGEELSSRAK